MTISEGRTFEDVDKGKQMVAVVHQSHDGSKPSRKDQNGADDRSGNYNTEDRYAYLLVYQTHFPFGILSLPC
jgi:peptidyl-prolyl isomerase G (cyclophilin G)